MNDDLIAKVHRQQVHAGEQAVIEHLNEKMPGFSVDEPATPQPVAKLLKLPAAMDKASTLETIDQLRAAVESGEVAAFYAVTICHDDATRRWCGQTVPVSRLRGMGAVSHLLACLHSGDI